MKVLLDIRVTDGELVVEAYDDDHWDCRVLARGTLVELFQQAFDEGQFLPESGHVDLINNFAEWFGRKAKENRANFIVNEAVEARLTPPAQWNEK